MSLLRWHSIFIFLSLVFSFSCSHESPDSSDKQAVFALTDSLKQKNQADQADAISASGKWVLKAAYDGKRKKTAGKKYLEIKNLVVEFADGSGWVVDKDVLIAKDTIHSMITYSLPEHPSIELLFFLKKNVIVLKIANFDERREIYTRVK